MTLFFKSRKTNKYFNENTVVKSKIIEKWL